jgi:uncharacterized protein (TIGR03067 family)
MKIKFWEVATGKERATLRPKSDPKAKRVHAVTFTPNGKMLVLMVMDGTVRPRNVADSLSGHGLSHVRRTAPASTGDGVDPKDELAKLQGTWTHLSREEGGKQVAGEAKDLKFVITGGKWTLGRDGEDGQAGTLKVVDAASTPKKLDLVITDGPNKGLTVLCVYQLDGEILRYCGNVQARPLSLRTKSGDGSYVSSFKRLNK